MPLPVVAAGQPIRSTHVNSFSRWVAGTTKDQSANFTTTSPTEYTVTVTNEETGSGLMLKGVYGATTAFTINKTGATFNVPVTASNLLLSSLFSSAGQILIGGGGTSVSTLNMGSAFQNLAVNGGGTGLTYVASIQGLLASAGSMIGASAANTAAHIPKGTGFQSLSMNAGATGQTWVSCAVASAVTQGDLFMATGLNAITRLAKGSTGQYLRSNATGPGWETVTATAAVEVITSTTLVASAASVTFSSIPGTYKHLSVHIQARGDTAAESTSLVLRLNGDTGTVYDWQRVIGQGTSASALSATTQTSMQVGLMPASSAAASLSMVGVIHIPNYAGTAFQKMIDSNWSASFQVGSLIVGKDGGAYPSASAITTIILLPLSGNFVTGSTITVYGFPS